jgi:D-alanyl-D-alanine carboxypeptidase
MADMTSGVANYSETEHFDDELTSDPYQVWKPEQLVQLSLKDSPLFDPGTEWHYSNTNTVLLGLVLEQVSGETIGQLYRERIIEPLGLQDTSFPNGADTSFPIHMPGLHSRKPILRSGAHRRYRLERLLDMDGRHDDLDGR